MTWRTVMGCVVREMTRGQENSRSGGNLMGLRISGKRIEILLLALLLLAAPGAVLAAPSAPAFLPGQPMLLGTQVLVMWMPVPNAVKYVVYMNGNKVGESPTNQQILPLPDAAGDYSFQVSAVDATGAEGPKSSPGVIKI